MPVSRAYLIAALLSAALALAPVAAGAQAYFTPLVTPPAAVGTCMPPREVPVRGDTTHVVQHRLVMQSDTPGQSRELLIITGRGRSVVYSDMTHNSVAPTSGTGADVVAITDTLGRMHGWWLRSKTTLPDSLIRKRPDSATLRHLGSLMHTTSSRTPLTAVDEARVRQMTTWMLKRCS